MRRNELPEFCHTTLLETGELVMIKKQEKGYYKTKYNTEDREKNQELADFFNSKHGITPAQKEAMVCGSMFGWQQPIADPQEYLDKAELKTAERIKGHIKDPVISVYYPIEGNLYWYEVAGKPAAYLDLSALDTDYMGKDAEYILIPDLVRGIPLMPVRDAVSENGTHTLLLEEGCVSEELELNQSYTIIARAEVAGTEFVMGENLKAPSQFVTWRRTPANDRENERNYYWGNYTDSREGMIEDFRERIWQEFEHKQEVKQQKQQNRQRKNQQER